MPSALELTPEKFHDFLSLTSSPAITKAGSPETVVQSHAEEVGKEAEQAPSFAQVYTLAIKLSFRTVSPLLYTIGFAGEMASEDTP